MVHGLRTSSCTKLMKALYSKRQSVQHEVKEIEIPVPWGKVAGMYNYNMYIFFSKYFSN